MEPVPPDLIDDSNPFDYGSDADPDDRAKAAAFAELDRLTILAERATEKRKEAEAALAKLKKAEEQLLNKDIPELMLGMRMQECTTSSGIKVTVKRDIKASLPGHERVEARQGALRWLIDHGHGGVIKNVVTVPLDRGDDDRADALVVDLRSKGFTPEQKKDVHASTLGSLVRELMEGGTVVPSDLFNLFDHKVAKLVRKAL